MIKISKTDIKELTLPEFYKRGQDYYEEGRVASYVEFDNSIEAVVSGSEEYKVNIDLDLLEFSCTCPVGDMNTKPCKHIVAVLLTKVLGEKLSTKKLTNKRKQKASLEPTKHTEQQDSDLAILKREIKHALGNVGYHYGNYWPYVNAQDRFSDYVAGKIQTLKDTKENARFLLDLAVWVDKEVLLNFDDSDGVFQDMNWEILCKAVKYLDKGDIEDLDLIYEYTKKRHEFDLSLHIMEAVLAQVSNPIILDEVLGQLNKLLEGSHENFEFNRESGVTILWKYYLEKEDSVNFERVALRAYELNYHALPDLVAYYLKRKDYLKIVYYGWPNRNRYYVGDALVEALEKLKDWDKLIIYYKEKLKDHFDLRTLKLLKRYYAEIGDDKSYSEFVENIKKMYSTEPELFMHLKDYDKVVAILTRDRNEENAFIDRQQEIEKYYVRFKILDYKYAIKLYQYLFEREIEKLKTSSRYNELFRLGDALTALGVGAYVRNWFEKATNAYPNKKKLVEGILSRKS